MFWTQSNEEIIRILRYSSKPSPDTRLKSPSGNISPPNSEDSSVWEADIARWNPRFPQANKYTRPLAFIAGVSWEQDPGTTTPRKTPDIYIASLTGRGGELDHVGSTIYWQVMPSKLHLNLGLLQPQAILSLRFLRLIAQSRLQGASENRLSLQKH